jgi:bifunctional enzyme CysN/CysC
VPAKEKGLLRFVTTGSVDDGKSTLIGRLLYESKAIFEDQFAAVERTSKKRGQETADLALLLDGLSAEREQGITIDVAYRYFETANRKFIIADTPGHIQYTRNTVTGASTADLAVILIDARNGVLTQSKRHGIIISLLQIPHLIVAINKMDLVGYSERVYQEIVAEYEAFSGKLDIHDINFIPVSALRGDNVTTKSKNMPWYDGATLLHSLETVHVAADKNLLDFRFPVQYVIRPHLDFRGYAGRIASGTISAGEEVVVLPSGLSSKVHSIVTYDGELSEAFAPQSIVLTLEDEIDISRGDMIVRRHNLPQVGDHIEATLCWMDEKNVSDGTNYFLKHTTKTVRAFMPQILYRIDVNTLHRERVKQLELNDIARVEIKTSSPLFFDSYRNNHGTGSFILIDPHTSNTVAAGMIREGARTVKDVVGQVEKASQQKSPHTVWTGWNVPREERETRNGHKAAVIWFTGYSGSGKSTLAQHLERRLFESGCQTMLLDGDTLRHGLCGDLGFSDADRMENIRRIGEVAHLFFESGAIVLCAFISPFEKDRARARLLIPEGRFFEIYTKCALDVCQRRDPKGLYQKALAGEIEGFTGISSPYEEPVNPEMTLETDVHTVDELTEGLLSLLQERGVLD